jgi:hypothetical protein
MPGDSWQDRMRSFGKETSDRVSDWAANLEGDDLETKLESAVSQAGQALSSRRKFPDATYVGTLRVTNAMARAIHRVSNPDEQPWLIIGGGDMAGCLVAFDDRLVIIKTGVFTGLVAGAMGGERTSVIYFVDITGIEYNSGLMTGVLEVLTASYQGSANKDYWRGTLDSRNADSNDPFVLSNTLPLMKSHYKSGAAAIQELRDRISKAKRRETTVVANVTAPASQASPADELKKFSDLFAAGAITQDEFDAVKRRILDAL